MKTIEEAAKELSRHRFDLNGQLKYGDIYEQGIIAGAEFAQRWTSIEEEMPETSIQEEGIFYSQYLNIKVEGYEHPFVGYYVKANDDEFFDFLFESIQKEIDQNKITHYRLIELK